MTTKHQPAHSDKLDLLEAVRQRLRAVPPPVLTDIDRLTVNPALELISPHRQRPPAPQAANQAEENASGLLLVWRAPDGSIQAETPGAADFLALKLVLEECDPAVAAREAGVPVGTIDRVIRQAVDRGILLSPPSRLRRTESFSSSVIDRPDLLTATVFTLQWHITNDCDLACLHCYDRSQRRAVSLGEGVRILSQLREFCLSHFVRGQVSFSGGNPFLHPDFPALYRAAADLGLATAILGNPVSRQQVGELLEIQRPAYLQVSLEGLEAHNDLIRGSGHFRRTLDFLEKLRDLQIPSEVMLTLTRDNLGEVLPLGEMLRDKTDAFTFNRLALFGSGAALALPDRADYEAFLVDYLAAMENNPVLALKDNHLNAILHRQERELFDGCAGHGCGAAFNFLALLPDGEVHACRKFPSLLGNVSSTSLSGIYHSTLAAAHREGSAACASCHLRAACRGCPAVTASLGGNPFTDLDPYCCRK